MIRVVNEGGEVNILSLDADYNDKAIKVENIPPKIIQSNVGSKPCIDNCPLANSTHTILNSSVLQALKRIKTEYGTDIFKDAKKFKALLNDILPSNDIKPTGIKNVLFIAIEKLNLFEELEKNKFQIDSYTEIRLISTLTNFGFKEELCKEAITYFVSLL